MIVNSAGVVAQNGTDHAFERNIDMLPNGVWRGVTFGLPHLLKSGGGSIINITSIAGITGSMGADGYGSAKHGVVGLTKDIALRHAGDNVRSNAVAPGYIRTQMTESFFANDEESDALINGKLRVPMRRWPRCPCILRLQPAVHPRATRYPVPVTTVSAWAAESASGH